MIRILAGSAVGWAMGWDHANFLWPVSVEICSRLYHVYVYAVCIYIYTHCIHLIYIYTYIILDLYIYICLNCSGERPSVEDIYNHGFAGQNCCYSIKPSRLT